jgi:hypothetical protein
MINQLLSILLATSIVACPLLCRGGAACCDNKRSHDTHACCNECHKSECSHSADRQSVPRNHNSRTPVEYGGCICGGAVVEDSALQHLVLEGYSWIALPAVDQLVAVVSDLQQVTISRTPLPDDSMNPGRALRCLMMSYLC